MEINGNQRISMIFNVSELFIRIYEMYECWKAHSNFELDIIASYMHSKLCGDPRIAKFEFYVDEKKYTNLDQWKSMESNVFQ